MITDESVKGAVYQHFAETGRAPSVEDLCARLGEGAADVRAALQRLGEARAFVFRDDLSILMAHPFSGVPTQHQVQSDGIRYFGNCAWDSLGILAALGRSGTVTSRCEMSGEQLVLEVGADGPEPSDWVFHCHVPVAQWWDDIVFT